MSTFTDIAAATLPAAMANPRPGEAHKTPVGYAGVTPYGIEYDCARIV
jgi:hypothetical protein